MWRSIFGGRAARTQKRLPDAFLFSTRWVGRLISSPGSSHPTNTQVYAGDLGGNHQNSVENANKFSVRNGCWEYMRLHIHGWFSHGYRQKGGILDDFPGSVGKCILRNRPVYMSLGGAKYSLFLDSDRPQMRVFFFFFWKLLGLFTKDKWLAPRSNELLCPILSVQNKGV